LLRENFFVPPQALKSVIIISVLSMLRRWTMLLDISRKFLLVLSVLGASTAASQIIAAQEPIRVETNQVLIPVSVLDEGRLQDGRFLFEVRRRTRAILGLTVSDFQVFDDGKQQPILNVTMQTRRYVWDFRDNKGLHDEFIGPGGGKWTSAEWPLGLVAVIGEPYYLIAYALPESPAGSCHQVKVIVNRNTALVTARREYCNVRHSASDPLNGTDFGKQLEKDLALTKRGKVGTSLLAVPYYSDTESAHVHIALDWLWKSLQRDLPEKIGIVGIVSKKDGSLVTRFSDLREFIGDEKDKSLRESLSYDINMRVTRYERQLFLPPGEYVLRVDLSDGTKFGRAEVPLTVETYDANALGMSEVSLCRQAQDASGYSPPNMAQRPGTWTGEPPGSYVPLISKDIEFKPSADTRFKKGDNLYTYFEVYEPLLLTQPPATVEIQMHILDQKTGQLMSDSQAIDATPYLRAGSPVIRIGREMDIGKLPKGSYRLDVRATDSAGRTTAWHTIKFTVD
jgi:hypothetical protein